MQGGVGFLSGKCFYNAGWLTAYFLIQIKKSSIVLCNKSNCEHEPYDENTNPDPTCDAALNKDLFFNCVPVISGEYVYLFGQADLSKGVVYREKIRW